MSELSPISPDTAQIEAARNFGAISELFSNGVWSIVLAHNTELRSQGRARTTDSGATEYNFALSNPTNGRVYDFRCAQHPVNSNDFFLSLRTPELDIHFYGSDSSNENIGRPYTWLIATQSDQPPVAMEFYRRLSSDGPDAPHGMDAYAAPTREEVSAALEEVQAPGLQVRRPGFNWWNNPETPTESE